MSLIWIGVTKNSHMRKTTLSLVWNSIIMTTQPMCPLLFIGINSYIHVILCIFYLRSFLTSFSVYGRCLSGEKIANLHENQFIKLNLNMNLTFLIFFHDPDFFFLTQNPQGTTEPPLRAIMPELRMEDNMTRHTLHRWITLLSIQPKTLKYRSGPEGYLV